MSTSRNIFWLSASRALALVLLALAYFKLYPYLGPFSAGQHQFVLSYGTIFAVIVDFGIQQYIIKKMSEEPEKIKKYFYNFFAVELVIALLIYGAMLGIALYNQYDMIVIQAIALVGLGMIANALTYPFLAVLSVHHDLRKVALINFINSMVNVGIIFATIYFEKSIVFLVSNQFIFGVIGLTLYYRYVKAYIPRPHLFGGFSDIHWSFIKQILIASLPFALLVGFSTIYNRIDAIIIQKYLGFYDLGLYAAAYRFFDLLGFFPSIVSFSLYPVFAQLMNKQAIADVRAHIEEYVRLMIAFALPLGVGGMILAEPLIVLLAKEEYIGGAGALRILIWAPAILCIYVTANALVISQMTKNAVYVTLTNVIINIAGNIILVPRIGIIGAAIMTIVSELIQGIYYFYVVHTKITHFSISAFFLKPLIASIIMGLAILPLMHLHVLITIAIGGIIYGSVLVLLRFFTKQDVVFIKNLLLKRAG